MPIPRGLFIITACSFLLSACGGGGGGSCDTPLTVDYVETKLTTDPQFTSHNITVSATKLIHSDGNQGNSYDIDQIILSKISATDGDTLALAYSAYASQDAPTGSYTAFYIDTDGDTGTGGGPNGIGAEVLILDPVSHSGSVTAGYYTWSGTNWVWGSTLGGGTSSTASYHAGCTLGLAIYIPWFNGPASLDLSNAHGLMMLTTFLDSTPNTPIPIDATSVFAFSFP
jgi:hypothetical protein